MGGGKIENKIELSLNSNGRLIAKSNFAVASRVVVNFSTPMDSTGVQILEGNDVSNSYVFTPGEGLADAIITSVIPTEDDTYIYTF